MTEHDQVKEAYALARISGLLSVASLVLSGLALIMALNGCAHPQQEPVHPVAIVAWPAPLKPTCDLPPVPPPYVIVGFPAEQKIYVTTSDMAGLTQYQANINAWAQEVARCLTRMTSQSP